MAQGSAVDLVACSEKQKVAMLVFATVVMKGLLTVVDWVAWTAVESVDALAGLWVMHKAGDWALKTAA